MTSIFYQNWHGKTALLPIIQQSQDDGIHPTREAQPFIADWMAKQLKPLVNL